MEPTGLSGPLPQPQSCSPYPLFSLRTPGGALYGGCIRAFLKKNLLVLGEAHVQISLFSDRARWRRSTGRRNIRSLSEESSVEKPG